MTPLAEVMELALLSDAQLATESDCARWMIFCYRTGRKLPKYDTAVKIVDALAKLGVLRKLKRRGVTLTVADLCSRQKRGKRKAA